jgi:hypothetical protein
MLQSFCDSVKLTVNSDMHNIFHKRTVVTDFMYLMFVLPEERQGKEIQSCTHSYKINKQSICKGQMAKIPIDNKSLPKRCEPPKKQVCHV